MVLEIALVVAIVANQGMQTYLEYLRLQDKIKIY